MKRFSTEIRLAIFLVILIAVVVWLAMRFGGFSLKGRTGYYIIFPDAQGLVELGPVQIAGVEAGTVSEVKLIEAGKAVKVKVSIDSQIKLHEDATAQINLKDLLGGKYVEITTGSSQKPGRK